jgi:hypothetical protein
MPIPNIPPAVSPPGLRPQETEHGRSATPPSRWQLAGVVAIVTGLAAVAFPFTAPLVAQQCPTPLFERATAEFWVFHRQADAGLVRFQLLGPFASRDNAEALMVKLAPDFAGLATVWRKGGKVTALTYHTANDIPPWPPLGP